MLGHGAAGGVGARDLVAVTDVALAERVCVVLVATGDTRLTDPTTGLDYPTSRPLFIRQTAGPALRGTGTCS